MACSKSFTNAEIKVRIKNIWTKFVSAVEPERLSDWLVQENVITPDQWQRIHNDNPTKESRCRGLLYHLFSIPHPRAFLVVRQALVEDNHYLLESIDNQEPGSGISSLSDIQTSLQESFTNDEIKGRIQNIWSKFVKAVDPDRLSDCLVQENVITSDQWQMIHSDNPIRQSRCRALLHHLNSIPHPRAFLVVRQALVEENHYLLDSIDNQGSGSRISSLSEIQTASQGGIWSLDAIEAKTRYLVPLPGFIDITTVEPDMLGLDDSPKQAKMPCGHVISPYSLIYYCQDLLTKGEYKFCCPSSNCNREWKYFLVRHVACLSPDEMYEVEKKIADNYLRKAWDKFRKCPGCQIWCFRSPDVRNNCVRCPICTKTNGGSGFTFCWRCEEKWLRSGCSGVCGNPGCDAEDRGLQILATCPTKIINSCSECPRTRGCPKCGNFIEHIVGSAHIICRICHCGFCFICLKEMKDGKWQCQPYLGTCKLAPRQAPLPGCL